MKPPRRLLTRGLFVAICATILAGWWWDRGGILRQIEQAQGRLEAFREDRELIEAELRIQRPTRIPGLEKIKVGMTLAEVESILGGPASETTSSKGYVSDPFTFGSAYQDGQLLPGHKTYQVRTWRADRSFGTVVFDEQDRAVCRY